MRSGTYIAAGLLVTAGALLFGAVETGAQDKIKVKPIKIPDLVVKFPAPLVKGIDPAAVVLKVEGGRKVTDFEAVIAIVGIVRNIGKEDFKSGKGQQAAYLYEENPGAKPRLVARREFQELKSGAYFTVRYERKWSTSMEFPPNYRLVLSYDPDIFIDANKNNDDINTKNNQKTLTGTAVTAAVQKFLRAK